MIELRRYQQRCVENFKHWLTTDSRIASITIPTGTGKSLSASACLTHFHGKVLWCAHRQELIFQAKEALELLHPQAKISLEMSEYKADPEADMVVGSIQTLAKNRKNLENFYPDIIVIDEYHHVSEDNSTYQNLFQRWPKSRMLVLSATPWRSSGEKLDLGTNLISMDIGTAVAKGYLVTPIPQILETNTSLAEVNTRAGDFELKSLTSAINVEERNVLIANKAIDLIKIHQRQGIIFAANVEHSKALFDLLKGQVRAAEIYGDTPWEERQELIRQIKNKDIDVVVNNMILTEGTDIPHLSFAIMARPTKLLGLAIQCIGRVLRLFPGKKDAIIVDVYDKIKVKQTRVTFKDVAAAGDLYGDRKRSTQILTAEPKIEEIAKKLINFPIFIRPEKLDRWLVDDEAFSISSWVLNPDQWVISWSAEVKTQKQISKPIWVPFESLPLNSVNLTGRPVRHPKFGQGTIKSIAEVGKEPKLLINFEWDTDRVMLMKSLERVGYIQEDVPNEFEINKVERLFYLCFPETENLGRLLAFERAGKELHLKDDKRLAKTEVEIYLEQQATEDGVLGLVKSNAKWKKQPASDKQIEFVKKLMSQGRIGFDLDLEVLNKGEVSAIIEQSKWQEVINQKFGTDCKNKLLGYDISIEDV